MTAILPIFARTEDVNVGHLDQICQQTVSLADFPYAYDCQKNVLIYQFSSLATSLLSQRQSVLKELHRAISDQGPGVLVIKKAFSNMGLLERHNALFERILLEEASTKNAGDHFAASGMNGRIWNAVQKVALQAPGDFIEYYKNPALGWVADAWLGPYWQMTSQVNIVRPDSKAQHPHRDYHLGFQSNETCEAYPVSVHKLSTSLTLQGAVAHTDMPLDSGPTMLLPFSHQYELGYLAWRHPEVIDFFEQNQIQLPLEQGDLLFFNPALLHAAGANKTQSIHRTANLLQISSSFGKAMESVDRHAMCQSLYSSLCQQWQNGQLSEAELQAVVACSAEGYSFPTNLDLDPPTGGNPPQTQAGYMLNAIKQNLSGCVFNIELDMLCRKRLA
jgi:ectoine hydroxylase-related dioxygenase (phytanoyl-CoA dioxygenase family)